ncbi:MAG: aldo/keto reductase [Kiritimatiellaeota bacterium]|nr:aldo/keto reductase [Kiritimatiellota bacterium]
MNPELDRREFLKKGVQATVTAAALVGANDAGGRMATAHRSTRASTLPVRRLGRTGVNLPMLGFGGAALPKKWGNVLSTRDRVRLVRHAYERGIRYFDTAPHSTYADSQAIIGKALRPVRDTVFIATKVEFWNASRPDGRLMKVPKGEVLRQIERNLRELQTDYIDAILIHGTPGIEQMTVEQCMEVHAELLTARKKGLVRFIGFSAHHYFDKALALISTGEFDLCMLAYGYLPRGNKRLFAPLTQELRNACLAKAHELGMGIVAMKVLGVGLLSGFGKEKWLGVPGAAIRYVLQDDRVHLLVIGMRFPNEVDANVKVFSGDARYTDDDRDVLAAVGTAVLSDVIVRKMKVE